MKKFSTNKNRFDYSDILCYLAGAGPGELGLITLRCWYLLQNADVILYDNLIPEDILKVSKVDARCVYVGKRSGVVSLTQKKLNALLIRECKRLQSRAEAGMELSPANFHNSGRQRKKILVRLKGGDPMIFARGFEEMEVLRQNRIPYRIVPGISSVFAVPSYAGIPLTVRGMANGFRVSSGKTIFYKNSFYEGGVENKTTRSILKKNGELKLRKTTRVSGDVYKYETWVILMSMKNIDKVVEECLLLGRDPNTSVAVITSGTTSEQKVYLGSLKKLKKDRQTRDLTFSHPGMIVVGQVASLASQFDWFGEGWFSKSESDENHDVEINKTLNDGEALENYSRNQILPTFEKNFRLRLIAHSKEDFAGGETTLLDNGDADKMRVGISSMHIENGLVFSRRLPLIKFGVDKSEWKKLDHFVLGKSSGGGGKGKEGNLARESSLQRKASGELGEGLSDITERWLIFTSVRAVDFFSEWLFARGFDWRIIAEWKVLANGAKVTARLKKIGIKPDAIAREPDQESVYKASQKIVEKMGYLKGNNKIKGKKENRKRFFFLHPTSDQARSTLTKNFQELQRSVKRALAVISTENRSYAKPISDGEATQSKQGEENKRNTDKNEEAIFFERVNLYTTKTKKWLKSDWELFFRQDSFVFWSESAVRAFDENIMDYLKRERSKEERLEKLRSRCEKMIFVAIGTNCKETLFSLSIKLEKTVGIHLKMLSINPWADVKDHPIIYRKGPNETTFKGQAEIWEKEGVDIDWIYEEIRRM